MKLKENWSRTDRYRPYKEWSEEHLHSLEKNQFFPLALRLPYTTSYWFIERSEWFFLFRREMAAILSSISDGVCSWSEILVPSLLS